MEDKTPITRQEVWAKVELATRTHDFLMDDGEYGYGGEWFSFKSADPDAITDFIWELMNNHVPGTDTQEGHASPEGT